LKNLDRLLAAAAVAAGVVSIVWLNDADKAPLYFLVGYALWRLK
jgi:hypothetical protein